MTPVVKPDEQIAEEQPLTQRTSQGETSIGTVNFDKGTDDISAPAAAAENNKIAEVSDVPLVSVDQMPQFPGGEKEMMRFIKLNLHYPR